MADLSQCSRAGLGPSGTERGQLLLATAFVLSILFVVLALLLNSAAYTGIAATSAGSLHGSAQASSLQADVTDGTVTLLGSINTGATASYSERTQNLTRGIDDWSDLNTRLAAPRSGSKTISLLDVTHGTRIVQRDSDRDFSSASGAGNWTLAPDVTRITHYRLTVSHPSLVDPGSDTSASGLRNDSVFRLAVTVDGTTDTWRMFTYRDGGSDVVVVVEDPSGALSSECRVAAGSDDTVTVDVTNATVGDTDCPTLAFVQSLGGAFDLQYERGSNAVGTYSGTVDVARSTVTDAHYGPSGSSTQPYAAAVLYDATVELVVDSPAYSYRTTRQVVAGDANG